MLKNCNLFFFFWGVEGGGEAVGGNYWGMMGWWAEGAGDRQGIASKPAPCDVPVVAAVVLLH